MKKQTDKSCKSLAFTLAEVLITLGIIGVVAAMTIPTLMQNKAKQETLSKLKKAYTTMAQAVKLSEIDNGPPSDWDWTAGITPLVHFNTYWAPYLKISKYCTNYSECGYTASRPWTTISGDFYDTTFVDSTAMTSVILADGTLLVVTPNNGNAVIYFDLNAGQKPNMFGMDLFQFTVSTSTGKGFMPYGHSFSGGSVNSNCNTTVASTCATKIFRANWEMTNGYPWN